MLGGVSFSFLDSTTALWRSDPALTKIMSLERHLLLSRELAKTMAKEGSPGKWCATSSPGSWHSHLKNCYPFLCVPSFLGGNLSLHRKPQGGRIQVSSFKQNSLAHIMERKLAASSLSMSGGENISSQRKFHEESEGLRTRLLDDLKCQRVWEWWSNQHEQHQTEYLKICNSKGQKNVPFQWHDFCFFPVPWTTREWGIQV